MLSNSKSVIASSALFTLAANAANPSFSLVSSAAQASGIAQTMRPDYAGFGE